MVEPQRYKIHGGATDIFKCKEDKRVSFKTTTFKTIAKNYLN